MKKKPTTVFVSTNKYWNGTYIIESIIKNTIAIFGEGTLEHAKPYSEWGYHANEKFKYEKSNFMNSESINTSHEGIEIAFESKGDANKFVSKCVMPAKDYNDYIDRTEVEDGIDITFTAKSDDSPFEDGDYMSDGMHYNGW